MSPSRRWNSLSLSVILAAGFLTSIGLLAIYGSSALKGAQQFGDPYFFVKKQCLFAFLGFSGVFLMQYTPRNWIARFTLPLLLASLVLLGLIFVPGVYHAVGGAYRWLRIWRLGFQPSEIAKLALVFFLAKNLSRPRCDINDVLRGILPNFLLLSLFALFLLKQPDFGTTALLFLVTFEMIYIAGISGRFLAYASLAVVGFGVLAVIAAPYRIRRVVSFLDPWADLQNGGFQIIQSYLGFQNGGLLGAGLGESRQKLFFLPEAHTDFIFSVIGEELGLLGSILVCLLFLFLVSLGYRIACLCKDDYARYLSFGLTGLIGTQAALNLGVVTGLLPTKGIPLPFISSGSSSLLAFLFATALIARLGQEVQKSDEDSS